MEEPEVQPGSESEEERDDSREGEGAGPAEDLEEDPAYSPEGPEKDYKGG